MALTRRKKVKAQPLPEGWVVTERWQAHSGRWVEPGTELTITGNRGRVKFKQHVVTPTAEWIDVIDRYQHFRSFHPSRVKTVHWKKKLR